MVARFRRLMLLVALLTMLGPAADSARAFVSIGFGFSLGGCRPWYGWHPGWGYYHPWYGYPGGPWCGPGLSVAVPPVAVHVPLTPPPRPVVAPPAKSPPPRVVRTNAPLSVRHGTERSRLIKTLRIGDREDRIVAAARLAGFRADAGARIALERALLDDREVAVRAAAAGALDALRDRRSVPTLRRAYVTDPSPDVRHAAYRAVIMIQGY